MVEHEYTYMDLYICASCRLRVKQSDTVGYIQKVK